MTYHPLIIKNTILIFLYDKLLYSIHQISIMLFNKYFGPYKKTK